MTSTDQVERLDQTEVDHTVRLWVTLCWRSRITVCKVKVTHEPIELVVWKGEISVINCTLNAGPSWSN